MENLIEDVDLADDHQKPEFKAALLHIIFKCFANLLCLVVSLPCLPLFLLGILIWGLPPTIPGWSRFCKFFIAAFTEGKPKENIPFTNRVLLFLIFFNALVNVPINGVCWYIDELVYPSYHKVNIDEPVFMISAPRTASTQICHYLENDSENFITPIVAESILPYIWVWKLVVPALKGLGMKQEHFLALSLFRGEASKRHEFKLNRSDTWDGLVQSWHFSVFSWYLGYSFMKWGFSYATLNEPIDEDFRKSFVPFTDCVLKKVMYCRGGPNQRMIIKGHFLLVARILEEKYPKARFFMIVRHPVERICSFINLLKVVSTNGPYRVVHGLFPMTWRVARDYAIHTQVPYCKQEMMFYKEPADNKLVIPFTMYVNNLSATLQCIYSFCNIPIPDDVVSNATRTQNTTHDRTKHRASYDPNFNKSLASLGVNEEKLMECLNEYIDWINTLDSYKKTD
ncbi:uncharacterized protein [Dysidea avara]|uniref:uncharacterized protein isoform X1 n=1 Tax=Dysidea avara TaxID=196820 RepID=UPI00332E8410